jgi:tetratricopeptide (TPR) repeat protein
MADTLAAFAMLLHLRSRRPRESNEMYWAYNLRMRAFCWRSGFSVILPVLWLVFSASIFSGQAAKKRAASGTAEADRATSLAESGHCAEAIPLLKRAIRQTADRDLKKRIGLDGLHCAMTRNTPYESLDFLSVLSREFPRDPEVLYAATHAYSDLSLRSSQDLAREAPFSFQVHELNAEALEIQGKWDQAAAEYRKIIDINPLLPGIHARLGRALLAKPQPSPTELEQAKKAFEEEIEIDPRNAGAEYVLGQLAANANDFATAITHFERATKLDSGFSEAFLALGTALNSAKRFPDAIAPLETYEKMAPDSPTGHYQLALAYAGAGRKQDANREAQLQRQASEALESVKRKAAIAQEKQTSTDTQPPEQK